MTERLYLLDTKTLSATARVVELVQGGKPIVRLDRTIFHPQGGGQKADGGMIGPCKVLHVVADDDHVDHYVDSIFDLRVGAQVGMHVDPDRRRLNSIFHTCTHHVVNVVQDIYPQLHVVTGHSWPGEARVEFEGDVPLEAISIELINARLSMDIEQGLSLMQVEDPSRSRAMVIGGYPPITCGGTHVDGLAHIRDSHVTAIKYKGGRIRVSFDCVPVD